MYEEQKMTKKNAFIQNIHRYRIFSYFVSYNATLREPPSNIRSLPYFNSVSNINLHITTSNKCNTSVIYSSQNNRERLFL